MTMTWVFGTILEFVQPELSKVGLPGNSIELAINSVHVDVLVALPFHWTAALGKYMAPANELVLCPLRSTLPPSGSYHNRPSSRPAGTPGGSCDAGTVACAERLRVGLP